MSFLSPVTHDDGLENLESGARVDDFLEWFPGVTREQVETVLEHAEHHIGEAPQNPGCSAQVLCRRNLQAKPWPVVSLRSTTGFFWEARLSCKLPVAHRR